MDNYWMQYVLKPFGIFSALEFKQIQQMSKVLDLQNNFITPDYPQNPIYS